jgi:hypothetical protein
MLRIRAVGGPAAVAPRTHVSVSMIDACRRKAASVHSVEMIENL